jgi:hypothetical protein
VLGRILAQAVWPLLLVSFLFVTRDQLLFGLLAVAAAGFVVALVGLGPDRLGRLVVILALLTAPINDQNYRPIPGGPITFSDLFLVIGFALLLPALAQRGVVLPLDWTIGAFVVTFMVLITALLTPAPFVALAFGLRLVAAAVIIPAAYLVWRPDRRTIEILAWAYVAGHMVSIAWGAVEHYPRWDGLATHPNFFAMAGTTALAILVHKWFTTSGRERHLALAAAVVCCAGIYLSGSRAALIVVVVMALMVPLVERTSASAFAVLGGGIVGVLALQWVIQYAGDESALGRLVGGGSASGSDIDRRNKLTEGIDKWAHSPIIGNAFDEGALLAHNVYLEVAIGIGVIGLAGFLAILWSGSRTLFTDHPLRRLGYVAVQFAATGMLTNSIWDRFVWTALGLGILAVVPLTGEDLPAEGADAQDSPSSLTHDPKVATP